MSSSGSVTDALVIRESTYALSTDSVEFPADLQEQRVQRLVERGLSLEEAASVEESERTKLVPLHLIRPCIGKGKGRHIYEAKMLQENATKFSGWRQFVDHLSPEARRAAKGLPRSIRDLGGRIVESYWDGAVPADEANGFGQGAVVGWSLPTPMVRELIDNDPEIVEASISANATAVKPVKTGDGQRAWLVEGIEDRGSVDWVTEAGAGGRVVALMEAAYEESDMDLMEAMTDEEFIEYVQEQRPHLLTEADSSADDAEDAADGGDDELAELVAKLMKRNPKLTRQQATAMAKKSLAEATTEGDTMGDVTPEALREALQSEDFRGVIDEAVQPRVKELVESTLKDERELIRAEARADADRQIALRDMRDEARTQIQEAKLPDVFASRARAEFDLTDRGPTTKLDVVDDVDDDGNVTKSAREKLQEAVVATVQEQRDLLAAANPTKVRGQGPGAAAKRSEGGDGGEEPAKHEGTLYASVLQEAGVDPSTAWDD